MILRRKSAPISAALVFGMCLLSAPAAAADKLSDGNTAWILTSTALVLFMTLPGLALFYGGLVRSRNLLSVLMHCFAVACLASVVWMVCGYALAFGNGGPLNAWIGGLGKALLLGVGVDAMQGDIPETVFFMFQMTFAIITPGLIVGAYVERIKFSAVLWISGLWLVLVYAPVAHWIWGGGWLQNMGVLDFAGGLVVHVTAGVSSLVIVAVLGPRRGFPREITPPHSPPMTMMGAAMLWVGWFGFNAGSALAANGSAGMAMTVTHISAAVASLVWMIIEWTRYGRPSLVGIVTGMVAGLATITPASGFVGPAGALVIGVVAGIVCFWMTFLIKQKLKIDDSLDVFAVHGVGGGTGIILVSFLAAPAFGGLGLAKGVTIAAQLGAQVTGLIATAIWSGVLTLIVVIVVKQIVGLRVTAEDETEGLDITAHGERAYNQ